LIAAQIDHGAITPDAGPRHNGWIACGETADEARKVIGGEFAKR
jgi:hypothetical protein